MGGGRVAAGVRHPAATRQAVRHRRGGSSRACREGGRAQRRVGRSGVDQRRELSHHEARRPAVRALCRIAAELPLRRHDRQTDHACRFFRTGRRYGGTLGHGAADLLCRCRPAAAAAAVGGRADRLGAPQSGALHLPQAAAVSWHHLRQAGADGAQPRPRRAGAALQRSSLCHPDCPAVACARCAAPALVAWGGGGLGPPLFGGGGGVFCAPAPR